MYLSGVLEIDPAQETEIKKVKPTSLFGKVLDFVSFGLAGSKQETETFTAVSILEQINAGLNAIGVNNIIRLAIDNYDFYYDDKGREADLTEALSHFKKKIDPIESELFGTIFMVFEHDQENLKILIEVRITRKHKVGEYPISIICNAVVKDFKAKETASEDFIKERMSGIFSNQQEYDNYVDRQKRLFDAFLEKLEYSIRKYLRVDDIRRYSNIKIIRPKNKIKDKKQIKHSKNSHPVYYGYYGWDDYAYYSWLWGDMMHEHNVYAHNIDIVDEEGNDVLQVGENGFNAGETDTLNTEAPFEPVRTGDVEYFKENEYADDLKQSGVIFDGDDESVDDDDSNDDSDDDFDDD